MGFSDAGRVAISELLQELPAVGPLHPEMRRVLVALLLLDPNQFAYLRSTISTSAPPGTVV